MTTIPPHDDDDDDGIARYLELFVSEGPTDGESDTTRRGWHCTLKWLSPTVLRAIADDLIAADESGEPIEPVLLSWAAALDLHGGGDDDN